MPKPKQLQPPNDGSCSTIYATLPSCCSKRQMRSFEITHQATSKETQRARFTVAVPMPMHAGGPDSPARLPIPVLPCITRCSPAPPRKFKFVPTQDLWAQPFWNHSRATFKDSHGSGTYTPNMETLRCSSWNESGCTAKRREAAADTQAV